MIKQLRKKVATVNLLLASIVFLSGLIIVFTFSYKRISNMAYTQMEMAIEFAKSNTPRDYAQLAEYDDIVVVKHTMNEQDEQVLTYYTCHNSSENLERLEKIIPVILESHRDTGMVRQLYSRYVRQQIEDSESPTNQPAGFSPTVDNVTNIHPTVYIAIMDNQLAFNDLGAFIASSLLTALVGLLCFFLISLLLADMSLKPVAQSWEQQKQFVADASHELKTPLSIIMANTEIIASNQQATVASQMKWIENTRSESKRMSELIANLLFLAKNEDGLQVQLAPVDFSALTVNMCLMYDVMFYENNKNFQHDIQENVELLGNEQQLKQLVTILLDNANKHSQGKGNIKLQLQCNNRIAILTVHNDSVTLSQDQLDKLFDRFYTIDTSRNNNNSGNGLGLSIAKLICETHNGRIAVESIDNRTTFTALLPIHRKDKIPAILLPLH